jgi:POT family proton-dependent oligopeptide transporter
VAIGSAASGQLAGLYDPENEAPYFGVLGAIAILIGVVLVIASRPVLRLMRGVR